MIKQILDELNIENGSNYKIAVLKKYQDNDLLKRVLKMTYDRVDYVFGVTMKNVQFPKTHEGTMTLKQSLNVLIVLNDRVTTGNSAIELVEDTLHKLNTQDADVFAKILNRDLRINMGRTNINKVYKNLIKKQPYMRCAIADTKAMSGIDWESGVYSQLKLDGTYRSFSEGKFTARSGKTQDFPILEKLFANVPDDYVLIGEMTLRGEKQRSTGNGLINSLNVPEEEVIFTIWDAIHVDEYKTKNGKTQYSERLEITREIVENINHPQLQLVPYKIVYSAKEAFEHFQEMTEKGLEGTVIKIAQNLWKDGTGKEQLKMKLEIDAEVRITGFTEGKKGTKREKTFGAIEFNNDEGTITGRTSGFTDKELEEFNNNREKYIGRVMTVQFNDVTKAKGSDTFALSHPRFIEVRDDKNETDTLKRVQEMKEMAMSLS